ncbi:hypothetical protein DFS34DRAFT_356916 [Phlyctochytrium arcticum]|nr:hypothetical protein DFS34DRAFT_356916 [Phlyctochytrium arcticum]
MAGPHRSMQRRVDANPSQFSTKLSGMTWATVCWLLIAGTCVCQGAQSQSSVYGLLEEDKLAMNVVQSPTIVDPKIQYALSQMKSEMSPAVMGGPMFMVLFSVFLVLPLLTRTRRGARTSNHESAQLGDDTMAHFHGPIVIERDDGKRHRSSFLSGFKRSHVGNASESGSGQVPLTEFPKYGKNGKAGPWLQHQQSQRPSPEKVNHGPYRPLLPDAHGVVPVLNEPTTSMERPQRLGGLSAAPWQRRVSRNSMLVAAISPSGFYVSPRVNHPAYNHGPQHSQRPYDYTKEELQEYTQENPGDAWRRGLTVRAPNRTHHRQRQQQPPTRRNIDNGNDLAYLPRFDSAQTHTPSPDNQQRPQQQQPQQTQSQRSHNNPASLGSTSSPYPAQHSPLRSPPIIDNEQPAGQRPLYPPGATSPFTEYPPRLHMANHTARYPPPPNTMRSRPPSPPNTPPAPSAHTRNYELPARPTIPPRRRGSPTIPRAPTSGPRTPSPQEQRHQQRQQKSSEPSYRPQHTGQQTHRPQNLPNHSQYSPSRFELSDQTFEIPQRVFPVALLYPPLSKNTLNPPPFPSTVNPSRRTPNPPNNPAPTPSPIPPHIRPGYPLNRSPSSNSSDVTSTSNQTGATEQANHHLAMMETLLRKNTGKSIRREALQGNQ